MSLRDTNELAAGPLLYAELGLSNMNVRSHKCAFTGGTQTCSAEANNLCCITTLSKTSSLPHKNRFHCSEDGSSCVLHEEEPLLSLSGSTENASDPKRV